MQNPTYYISGKLLNNRNQPIPNLRVEAWDKDLIVNDFVGEATTDSTGQFQISFTQGHFQELFFDKKPDLYFKIYQGDKLIHSTEDSVLWNVVNEQNDIEIIIEGDYTNPIKQIQLQNLNTVFGKVSNANGRPLANLKVIIYDVDMRNWQPLTDTYSDKEGKYELKWTHEQLSGRGKKGADVALKVFTKEKNTELYKSGMDEVRFNAGEREEINIAIKQAIPTEVIEFEFLVRKVSFLARDIAIAELQDNKDHQDVTFLSRELELPLYKIEHLIVAHRLQNLSQVDANFFYALLRKNTLLTKNLGTRLSIGIHDEVKTILYDAVLADEKRIEADVEIASDEKIVSAEVIEKVKRNIEILAQYRKEAEAYYRIDHPKKVIELLASVFKPGKLAEVQQLFQENKNDLNAFFEKITDALFFDSKDKEKDAKTALALGKLLGFGNEIIPQIIKSKGINKPEDIRKLAKLNKAAWVKEISSANPSIEDDQLISTYSSAIVRKFEKEFPTMAFAAQLEREERPLLLNQDKIVSFFSKHEDFDLHNHNVDLYLKEKKVDQEDDELIKEELKSVQRIFKIIPNYSKINALREEKIHSAQSIVAIGETRFIKEIAPKIGLTKKEAYDTFRIAETKHTAAVLLMGDLQDSISVKEIASFQTKSLALKIEAVTKDFPNLKSLFKLVDTCECEHCRSVYSPAAYLVEILQFLKNCTVNTGDAKSILFNKIRRPDLGEIDLSCANSNTPVKYIDLVCELLENAVAQDPGIDYTGNLSDGTSPLKGKISNALLTTLQKAGLPVTPNALIYHTESANSDKLPHYLRDTKLVCKIVNIADSYKVFRLRQTLSTAEELDASPEYVNKAAYKELLEKSFAFDLPFDLNHTEAKAYFNRFNINRADLMKDFQSGGNVKNPLDQNIAAERLGLTLAELNIIVSSSNDNAAQQAFWNVPGSETVLDYMKRVDHFLDKTRLSYKELDLLLKLDFIDPTKNLFIKHSNLTCNTEEKEIANLDLAAFDRIHRFLRLQKKTGWKFEVLGAILSQNNLGNNKLDAKDDNTNGITNGNECLIKAAQLKEISEKTGIRIEELIGCFGTIPHTIYNEELPQPLYHQIFLNKAKNGIIHEAFLPEKINDLELLTGYADYLATCLQLSQTDLEYILNLLKNLNLSFANLSYLYAASILIKKLNLKPEDFAILISMSRIDISLSPQNTLDFIKVTEDFKNSPLNAADVNFYLNSDAAVVNDREIKNEKIAELLSKLKKDTEKLNKELKSKYDKNLSSEEQKETLHTELLKLNKLSESDPKIVLQIIDSNWNFKWTDELEVEHTSSSLDNAKIYLTKKLDGLINVAPIIHLLKLLDISHTNTLNANSAHEGSKLALEKAQIAIKVAVTQIEIATAKSQLTAADTLVAASLAAFITANAELENIKRDFIKTFLNAIAEYLIAKEKIKILQQYIATGFQSDLGVVDKLLKYARLNQQGLISILLSDDNSEPSIKQKFTAIRLVYKILLVANAFKLSNTEVEWFLKNNVLIGWMELDGIPYETEKIDFEKLSKYLTFAKIVSYTRQYPTVANPVDADKLVSFFSIGEMLLPTSTTSEDEFMQVLGYLTGYLKDDLKAIHAHLFPTLELSVYKDPNTWDLVLKCAETLRKLGASVAQVKKYIVPVLTPNTVNDLRASLKSRYDENTWLRTLKEIMDTIRPQKRDALIAYLLATNPGIKDKNDLYEYFLVDVEMEACMPSSRIVLAHNSIQLFVQRCLMGLEPSVIANVEIDPNWNQWKWMKNYRVWEANRKVFLYPENWYDVTLSDDKTYLLTEFINEIQQNELTNHTAEDALKNYLEKLDNIAFLEVMATWYDVPTRQMHVFARTKGGDPSIYYYRRLENENDWSPWEKVELDITGDHLIAFKRNNRLCLAWPMFSEDANPEQTSIIPKATDTSAKNDKPAKKLKIQLAISEYTNKKWQPKRVSKEAILTPSDYSNNDKDFIRDIYYLRYFSLPKNEKYPTSVSELICIFKKESEVLDSQQKLCGVFNLAGCKGYPELVFKGDEEYSLPNFLPEFIDTSLVNQRHLEQNKRQSDDLSVRNGINIFDYYTDGKLILNQTPGNFNISYPHQFTDLDLLSLLLQLLPSIVNKSKSDKPVKLLKGTVVRNIEIPTGTLLPYFKEDSNHSYVIIPGFYTKTKGEGASAEAYTLNDSERKTASNVIQLMDEIGKLVQRINKPFNDIPAENTNARINIIITDPEWPNIIKEISKYNLTFIKNILKGKTDNVDNESEATNGLVYGEQFKNMYHPLVCALRTILYQDGIPELMKRTTQLQETKFNFETYYKPNPKVVPQSSYKNPNGTSTLSYPIEDIDFNNDGSYSAYNWDLFFRVPLHIACSLTKNQRYEEAMTWFHYMFNPTGALDGNGTQKYWITKPFFLNQEKDYETERIDALLNGKGLTTKQIDNLELAISKWRNNPFRPDVVARFRPVAYQKALLMKYLDNLTEWGDYLFRQDTMESIAQATQMYIMADKLLGPKPKSITPTVKAPYETYNQLESKLDSFGNALIELENILPDLSMLPEKGAELPPPPVTLSMLYFCIPPNEKMVEYWNRIADRLFKIRHCQSIDGVERSLALFAPPIDPGMLVRAAASGLDISSVLAGLNAPTPYYRFNVLSQKATELAQEVRGLGNSLLQALEKKDAEALSLLRNELESKVLNAVKEIKILQIKESKEQIVVLNRTKNVTEERRNYYANIKRISALEITALGMNGISAVALTIGSIMEMTAGATKLIPDATVGASGFGGSPVATLHAFGGDKISGSTSSFAKALILGSQILDKLAGGISTIANYERRFDDWKLQERLAIKELVTIEQQIKAAEIRKEIAETDLKNHELQIENAKKTDEFMRSKFTNKELYDWMIGQISSVYFKSYQLAHDFCKKAERCYRFELGNEDSFISFGYWGSMKKGLQCADNLIHDIKRMEGSYLDKNKREYEITKHISIAQLDPFALVRLRATGVCDFDIPEVLYDMDHPGQYFRRLKSVSLSIPCIAGPYTSVSAKMSLVNNKYRKVLDSGTDYVEDPGNDNRFNYNIGAIQSIATSNAQNDSGVFELNFRDERYLPFENTGAISSWRLELPTEVKQFDYNTISDVVLHIKYTAREGGSGLKMAANKALKDQLQSIKQGLGQKGMHVALNGKQDFPNEFHLLKKNVAVSLTIDKTRLPYMMQSFDKLAIESVMFILKVKKSPIDFAINIGNTLLEFENTANGILSSKNKLTNIKLDEAFKINVTKNADNIEELFMIVNYKI